MAHGAEPGAPAVVAEGILARERRVGLREAALASRAALPGAQREVARAEGAEGIGLGGGEALELQRGLAGAAALVAQPAEAPAGVPGEGGVLRRLGDGRVVGRGALAGGGVVLEERSGEQARAIGEGRGRAGEGLEGDDGAGQVAAPRDGAGPPEARLRAFAETLEGGHRLRVAPAVEEREGALAQPGGAERAVAGERERPVVGPHGLVVEPRFAERVAAIGPLARAPRRQRAVRLAGGELRLRGGGGRGAGSHVPGGEQIGARRVPLAGALLRAREREEQLRAVRARLRAGERLAPRRACEGALADRGSGVAAQARDPRAERRARVALGEGRRGFEDLGGAPGLGARLDAEARGVVAHQGRDELHRGEARDRVVRAPGAARLEAGAQRCARSLARRRGLRRLRRLGAEEQQRESQDAERPAARRPSRPHRARVCARDLPCQRGAHSVASARRAWLPRPRPRGAHLRRARAGHPPGDRADSLPRYCRRHWGST